METDRTPITVPALQQMKRDGRKIVGVVAWDYQMAQIVDRAGADIVSVGDTVGMKLLGPCQPAGNYVGGDAGGVQGGAPRREAGAGELRFSLGPLQEGADSAVRAAIVLVKEAGADMVKLDGAADFPEAVREIVRAGIPVFAQMGITPQTALRYGVPYSAASKPGAQVSADMTKKLVEEAKRLEDAGASLIDFTNSGPIAGAAVAAAVSIPVVGGFGGGPWLDGRMRMAHAAIGYAASNVDTQTESYANIRRGSRSTRSARTSRTYARRGKSRARRRRPEAARGDFH